MGEKRKHNPPRGIAFVKAELRRMYKKGINERYKLWCLHSLLGCELLLDGKPWGLEPFGLAPKIGTQGKYSKRGRPRVNPEEPEDAPMPSLAELMEKMGESDGVSDSTGTDTSS
jgi:hypothetical protein